MDNGFKEVRRRDRLLDDRRAIELLEEAEYGFLSVGAGENGYAYGIPISFAYSREDNAIYFHCAPQGHKLDNMALNDRVSFCVVGRTRPVPEKFTTLYESVIVFGRARINPADDDKRKAIRKLVAKYCPEHTAEGEIYMEKSFNRTHTFRIDIEYISAKSKNMKL